MQGVRNTRADEQAAVAAVASRVRDYYGNRLVSFLRLPEDPFEEEQDPQALHFVAVVQPEEASASADSPLGERTFELDTAKEIDAMAELAYEADDAFGHTFISTVHVISEEHFNQGRGYVAEKARQEGEVR